MVTDRITLMADDLGRLKSSGVEGHVVDRLCSHVEWMDADSRMTAAERVAEGVSVVDALAEVDHERNEIERRMRWQSRR